MPGSKEIAAKQSIPQHLRYSFEDFNRQFPENDSCLEHIKEKRWPHGVTYCGTCKADKKHHRVSGRTAYACETCGWHIYPLAGTILEKTTTSLRTWFYAMYLMGSTRCGISAKQIQRETSVTYKTAWRMFKQIRTLLKDDCDPLSGSVEMDETYMGGKRKGNAGRPMRGDKVKTPVLGMVERRGRAKAFTIESVDAKNLVGLATEHILPSSIVYTDELNSYNTLAKGKRYDQRRINHSAKVYVIGDIHTNSIEGFWSLIKRGIGGVYHQVSQKYLQTYLDEYSYRYNRRDQGNLIFHAILAEVSKRAVD
jgi:transposase-like protein